MAQIKKLGERRYLIRASKGTGRNRTYINTTFRGTLKKARGKARDLETLLDSGLAPESTLTFEAYFKLWLAAVKPKIAPRTYDGYEGYIKRYAEKSLGKLPITSIRTSHIQSIYIEMGKSPTTVRNLHASLNACFSYALKHDYLRTNPCKNTDLPARERPQITVLNIEEGIVFNRVCREMLNGIIFAFALETGMRPEEYLALRWSDIDDCEISVSQAVQFNRSGGGYYFKDLKTARSRRRIPISDELRKRLVTHRREQNEHRLAMKGTWFNHNLVFANEIGRPYAINNLTRRYLQPILEKCAFDKHLKLYSLRHSCATILLMLGENPKVVADRLGHASVTMTLDTYSHVLPHIQADATAKIAKALRGA